MFREAIIRRATCSTLSNEVHAHFSCIDSCDVRDDSVIRSQSDEAHKHHQPPGRNRSAFRRHVAELDVRESLLVNLHDDDSDSAVLPIRVCPLAL